MNSTTTGSSSQLRADAPQFVPSFQCKDPDKAPHEKSPKAKRNRRKPRRSKPHKETVGNQRNRRPNQDNSEEAKDKKTSRRRNRRGRRPPQSTQSEHKETNSQVEALPKFPLHDDFPSLVSAPSTKPVSLWQTSGPKLRTADPSPPDDFFLRAGLQKLSPKRSIPLSLQSTNETVTTESDSTETIASTLPERTTRWNINRLRDKWWDALALRKAKLRLMTELQEELQGRIIDPDFDSVSETSESGPESNVTEELLPPKIVSEQPEDQGLALQRLMDIHDRHGWTGQELLVHMVQTNQDEILTQILDLWGTESPDGEGQLNVPAILLEQYDSVWSFLAESLKLTVRLDKPQLLKALLTNNQVHSEPATSNKHKRTTTPSSTSLMIAAELGHEECLSLLLTKTNRSFSSLASKDSNGNNVFHYCCRGNNSISVLQLCLKHLGTGTTKGMQQQLSKLLLTKNNHGQTPLHVACIHDRVDIVETFLYTCSSATLAKLLATEDDSKQTPLLSAVASNAADVVMCLIMWRGNHGDLIRQRKASKTLPSSPQELPSCPLVWAAKDGNVDMIHLLLQFSDPSGGAFFTTDSISALLQSDATHAIQMEGAELLIQNGGNPFKEISTPFGNSNAVMVASKHTSAEVLRTVVLTGMRQLESRQQQRRKDPKLQKQPEAFFEAMEVAEDFEMKQAMTSALLQCLYSGWVERDSFNDNQLPRPLANATALYSLGAQLKGVDQSRLKLSLLSNAFDLSLPPMEQPGQRSFVAAYRRHPIGISDLSKIGVFDRRPLSHASKLLADMAWLKDDMERSICNCPWLANPSNAYTHTRGHQPQDLVVLVAQDGARFDAHETVVSKMSDKLASAIRFAAMQTPEESNGPLEIDVAISSRNMAWMLQHIYHGSIACGWSRGRDQNCLEILELMVVAEEFLCSSLVQECEMRLLASQPTACFCWSCAKSVRFRKEGQYAECLYFVDGPSRLVSPRSVMDVLAVVQHLEATDLNYSTKSSSERSSQWKSVSPSAAWNLHDKEVGKQSAAVSHLKEAAVATILSEFSDVVHSGSFQEAVIVDDDETTPEDQLWQQVLLLQMCLEELSNAPRAKGSDD